MPFLRGRALSFLGIALIVSAGCATGGDDTMRDSGGGDDLDAGALIDAGPRRDAGPVECGPGQHECGGGCIDDLANDPALGCRFGCGEPCPAPPDGVASCEADGTCSFGCEPPFRNVDGECVCVPATCESLGYMCGAPDNGCLEPLDCGDCDGIGVCNDGTCECPMDAREPNEGRLAAPTIDALADSPAETATYDMFSLHSASDSDWFAISITDATDATNPTIDITLAGVPAGSVYTMEALYICGGGDDASNCTLSSPCTASGSGSIRVTTECEHFSTDDSGTLYVHVGSSTWGGSCAPYELTIAVD